MKQNIFFILFIIFISSANAQKGYEISITLKPYKNQIIYLGSYIGKNTVLLDSVIVDSEGKGIFKGKEKFTEGIYFIVSPTKSLIFDFLLNDNQQFSIIGDTSALNSLQFIDSKENSLNQSYAKFMTEKMKEINSLNEKYSKSSTRKDSLLILDQFKIIESEEKRYKQKLIKENPGSLMEFLLSALKRPEVPKIPIKNGKPDSLYAYRYVKDHYWDGILFNDDRLLHTPFFESKLDDYYKYYVSPDSDSIINEVKYMLLSSRSGKEIFPFLLTKFTNKYINPEYMGQDKVFIYLFENFYAKGDTSILNPASTKIVTERAYNLMANLIGLIAPPLNLTDTSGKITSLYGITAPYTIIAYWDPNCGHCKEEIPVLDSIYRAKWKSLGVAVYSIKSEGASYFDWKLFIKEHKLPTDWKHVYETEEIRNAKIKAGKIGLRQLYDFSLTPSIYLLDKDKRIIAKKLSLYQFDEIINAKIKK